MNPDIYYLMDQTKPEMISASYIDFENITKEYTELDHDDLKFGFSQMFHSLAITARMNAITFEEMKQTTIQWLTDLQRREVELHKKLRESDDPPEWISGKKMFAADTKKEE